MEHPLTSTEPYNLFQSPLWAAQKERFGWRALRGEGRHRVLLLMRSIGGPFSLGYLPYAGTGGSQTHLGASGSFSLEEFIKEVEELLDRCGLRPTFVRWDVPFPQASLPPQELSTVGLRKAGVDIQPPDTVVLSLEPSEEELLAGMKQKTRYNIRLADKRNVEVRLEEPHKALSAWYELYRVTSVRDRIAIHSYEYYRSLFDLACEATAGGRESSGSPEFLLYHAYHEGELLAGIVVARFAGAAYYLYGASSNEKRNLMPAYALQWQAIRDARESGCRSYDFFGIPPAQEPDHPMHGLYRFKVGFGGDIIRRPGAWDLPLSRGGYAIYRRAEALRHYYYKVLKKRG